MNLYDTAGIGSLLGGMAGIKLGRDFLVGAFGGLESTPYISRLDAKYLKAGAFVRWLGAAGPDGRPDLQPAPLRRRASRGSSPTPRLPARPKRSSSSTATRNTSSAATSPAANRLSRLFGNVRLDLGRWADVTASYSSGKGLDFHRYLIEASQDPTVFNQDVERFYYSSYYGVRLSVKPARTVRLSVAPPGEPAEGPGIVKNHTWRFGASASNLFGQGLSVVGNYAVNRGDLSESDTYYVSLTKDFGRFSLNGSYSNVFNGLRIDPATGDPQIIHLADYRNVVARDARPAQPGALGVHRIRRIPPVRRERALPVRPADLQEPMRKP